MTTLCAWCQAELPESERDTRPGISHGICKAHVAKMRAEIQKRKTAPVEDAASRRTL